MPGLHACLIIMMHWYMHGTQCEPKRDYYNYSHEYQNTLIIHCP